MAISRTSANIMYATSGNLIYKSTNRGYTFTDVSTGLPNVTITSVNIHPDSSQVAIITFSGFRSREKFIKRQMQEQAGITYRQSSGLSCE
ncbi:MAG: hypothetical protein IPI04_04455 [Ignavibacteria bacterium]|nr:hypothetical protein [Ignavibacteria bacterium]